MASEKNEYRKEVTKGRSLYPSTLFHFTEHYSALTGILDCSYFKVSHSTEMIHGKNETPRNFSIPMVSFCDIRLSHLTEHTGRYGGFGIGLKKSWGIEKGLNPVFYVNQNCSMVDYFNAALRDFKEEHISNNSNTDKASSRKAQYRDLINPLRYMKNYEADLVRTGKDNEKNYRFANENEWRYVPDIRSDIVPIRLSKNKQIGNDKLGNHPNSRLYFTYDDIRYIFVSDDLHLEKLISHINKTVIDKYRNKLLSKIFVTSNIFEDL
ncbi:abortive infection system antitoxin AbiGi family protein [Serratia rubidaea]|uniref:abortive infection system antitoxin AbiGi family protein n=1 Tax=Serratia rubidaea TaxID=61652 RepID=UPI002DBB5978|nr:abortive infection system antitoxin AbiGi family protein [Serratia rubidaea]MEB7585589.1 abortive infection system antitoxin AbiGi family protein [Serratia rubidaea]